MRAILMTLVALAGSFARGEVNGTESAERFKIILQALPTCHRQADARSKVACNKTIAGWSIDAHHEEAVRFFESARPRLTNAELQTFVKTISHYREYVGPHCALSALTSGDRGAARADQFTMCFVGDVMMATFALVEAADGVVMAPAPSEVQDVRADVRPGLTALNERLFQCLRNPDPAGACADQTLRESTVALKTAHQFRRGELSLRPNGEGLTSIFDGAYATWDAYKNEFCEVVGAVNQDPRRKAAVRKGCLTNLTLRWIRDVYATTGNPRALAI